MAATSERLGGLHDLFTAYWEHRMQEAMHPDPELRVGISAAEQAVLRAFLKDNGVQAEVTGNAALEALTADLKEATKGVVSSGELKDIMDDFNSMMPQIGVNLQ